MSKIALERKSKQFEETRKRLWRQACKGEEYNLSAGILSG